MRTDDERREMAGHVIYEIEEFCQSIAEYSRLRAADGEPDRHALNRRLESKLLHFRVLRGFFIDAPKKNDASAVDYVGGWAPVRDPIFSKTKDALDQKLAHLTWKRVPRRPGNWDLDSMKTAIDNLFEEFKKCLTAPASKWFAPTASTGNRPIPDKEGNSTVSWSRPGSLL